jgi:hypothetical protein
MDWLLDQLTNLIVLLVVVIVVMALFAPFETLGWWAGWNHLEAGFAVDSPTDQPAPPRRAAHYVVYLTGVGGFSGEFLRPPESAFVDALQHGIADAVVVHDIFPYSADNNPLNGQRVLAGMWQWLERMRERVPNNVFDVLIVVRNSLQVGISSDPRYGPLYNRGVAHEIAKSLHRHGYPHGSGQTVSLVGYSGGVQVALGAAPFLRHALQAPLHVISIGGVMASDPGIRSVERIDHLMGSKDLLPPLGVALYAGRWRVMRHSNWNRARRAGTITSTTIGPIKHFGHEDYFSDSARLPNGRTYREQTVALVAALITGPADRHRST